MKFCYPILLVIFLLISCRQHLKLNELYLPDEMREKVLNKMNCKKILVYYHSGECAFCYGILAKFTKEYPTTCVVSIGASSNTKLVDYYLDEIKFTGISLIDSSFAFYKSNQMLLNSYNLFLIDQNFNIQAEGIGFDEPTKKKIDRQLLIDN